MSSYSRKASGAPAGEVRGLGMEAGVPTSGTTFAGSQRVLVRSSAGTLYLAYTKKIRGVDQVYVARSIDNGMSWTDFDQISDGDTNSNNPDLVIDKNGRLSIFWTKHELTPPTGEPSTGWKRRSLTRAAKAPETAAAKNGFVKPGQSGSEGYDEDYGTIRQLFTSTYDGRKWSPQVQLTHGDYNGFPSAAYDSQGVLHMVWYGYDGHNYQVIYSPLKNDHWSPPVQISGGYPDSVNPTIAVDARNNLHVAWYKYSPATKSYQIYYREYLAAQGAWGAADQEISEGLKQAENVTMAIDPTDTVWVAWEGIPGGRRTVSGVTEIYVRSFKDGLWSRQRVVSPLKQSASEPSIATDAQSGVYIFFQSNHQIYLAKYDGRAWEEPRKLTSAGKNGYPNVRWSRYFNAAEEPGGSIDYVWTELDARPALRLGANLIRFASIPVP